jgi:branched-chain amino acid aminotransferase
VGELAFAGEKLIINGGQPGPVAQKFYEEIGALQRAAKPDTHGWLSAID